MKDTQLTKILKVLKENSKFGATNYQLSRISLNYTRRISDLRKEGYNIYTERQYLKNGRATNTFRYILLNGGAKNETDWLLNRGYEGGGKPSSNYTRKRLNTLVRSKNNRVGNNQ